MAILLTVLGIISILVGVVGVVIPIVPAGVMVAAGAVLIGWAGDFTTIGWGYLSAIIGMGVISIILDQLAPIYGARKTGGSRAGIIGAIVGGVAGIFFGPPGILLGPLVGAVLFEIVAGSSMKRALSSGWGTLIGQLYGFLGKVIILMVQLGLLLYAWI